MERDWLSVASQEGDVCAGALLMGFGGAGRLRRRLFPCLRARGNFEGSNYPHAFAPNQTESPNSRSALWKAWTAALPVSGWPSWFFFGRARIRYSLCRRFAWCREARECTTTISPLTA